MANRTGVLRGSIVDLIAIFLDADGNYTDPDPTTILVSIYPVGKHPSLSEESDAWVLNASLTSEGTGDYAIAGNYITRESTGRYLYSFTVPEESSLGSGYDYWTATVEDLEAESIFSFIVLDDGTVTTTSQLYNNNIIYIWLSKYITSTDGSRMTSDYEGFYTTTYTPMYTAIRRIRLDMGPFLVNVPDDTINLAIFEASLMADVNTYTTENINSSLFLTARREYTTCLAELILARALLGDSGISERMSKTLGDLSVSRGGNLNGLKDALDRFEDCVIRWETALQSGGNLGPGMSVRPQYSVKGMIAEDALHVGRTWEPTYGIGYNHESIGNANRHRTDRRTWKTYRKRHGV